MESLFVSIFTCHNPAWIDIQQMLNTLLTAEEQQTVLEKAREVANCLHNENPQNLIKAEASLAIPTINPWWNVNDGIYQGLNIIENVSLLG